MTRLLATVATLLATLLTGCASMDAAHIKGQEMDAQKYQQYTDVELQKQTNVQSCFNRATTDNQIATCALMGVATGMASTFGGRPTNTKIAPTTAQAVGHTAEKLAPYGAAAKIADSVADVQAKDPIVVQQPAPVIVEVPVLAP
jgi:outer membrane lipoprotein SlyB